MTVLGLVALTAAVGCDPGQEGGTTGDAGLAAVRAVADSFAQRYRAGDAEGFAQLFTEDATYAANNGQLLEGRQEILAAAREWVRVPQDPTRRTLKADVVGDVAYLLESYTNEIRIPDAPVRTITGRSLGVLRRQEDGRWRIEALVVNRDPAARE